ncbi:MULTISPECIES: glycosyl transferase family 90 [Salinicola]|nr:MULTISPECIES: glycosyl transferase family 90 [Salinicola]MDF3918294.1 glycosyl transferase family 90 [Salinicola salarius]
MDVPVCIFARFREGTLEPYVHYVPLADDCSDLEAKMDYYIAHPDEA